jgi:protein SCO1
MRAWTPAFAGMTLLMFSAIAGADPRSDQALDNISFTPPLGSRPPLDLAFRDESGAAVRIGDLLRGKPALIVPVYYECPMLCTLSLNGLLKAARALRPTAGIDYTVIAVSIDPEDTPELAAAKRASYQKGYNRPGSEDGWRFLTGDTPAIDRLTRSLGFAYVFDEKSGQFGHASALAVLSPDGMLTRGLNGPEFEPRDLKLALIEASQGKIGTPVDRAIMYCFAFDGATGTYSLQIMRVVRLAGAATALGIFLMVGLQIRRERRRRTAAAGGGIL